MTHPSVQDLESYATGDLPPEQLLYVADHLGICRDCSERSSSVLGVSLVDGARDWRLGLVSPLGGLHLEEAELEALVEGKLSGEALRSAEVHVKECLLCWEDVEDLRRFRTGMLAEIRPRGERPAEAGEHSGWREAWAAWLRSMRVPSFAAGAALGALAAVAIYGVGLPHRTPAAVVSGTSAVSEHPSSVGPGAGKAVAEVPSLRAEVERLRQETSALRSRLARAGSPPAGAPRTIASTSPPKSVPVTAEVTRPQLLTSLVDGRGRLMGSHAPADGFGLLSPVGTAVFSDRPTLSWTAQPGADAYRVVVYDGGFREVARGDRVTGTSWEVELPLERGQLYRWQVVALKGEEELGSAPGPTDAAALFHVLDAGRAQSLNRSTASAHLELGRKYAAAGLLDDAERELRAAVAESDPPTLQAARRLLDRVRGWRRADR